MQGEQRLSPVNRLLRLFAEVRPGESSTALLLSLDIFLILTAYYFIKPVREALILDSGGAELKSYLSAGQAILLLAAVPAYGALASRMPRRRLINVVTVFFAACLVVFYLAGHLGAPLLAQSIIFFLWIGIFNLMFVAQFWSFANDIYSQEEGERLFPIVAFGASAGAVMGSYISGSVIELVGLYEPMLVASGLLLLAMAVTNLVDTRERGRTEADLPDSFTSGSLPAASQEIPLADVRKALSGEIDVQEVRKSITGEIRMDEVRRALEGEVEDRRAEEDARSVLERTAKEVDLRGVENPYRMVFAYPYLVMIAFLMLFITWVNTNGEYILGKLVETTASAAVASGEAGGLSVGEYIGAFYSRFYAGVNALGLFIQLFLVSRAIKYLGVSVSLLVLPVIALGANTLIAFLPLIAYVRWAKTAENATDYSLQNTVRNVLFLPCTREQKYKAKQAIDSFFVRAGDVSSAVLVFLGTTYFAMAPRHFGVFNIVLVLLTITLVVLIGRQYRQLTATGRPPAPRLHLRARQLGAVAVADRHAG